MTDLPRYPGLTPIGGVLAPPGSASPASSTRPTGRTLPGFKAGTWLYRKSYELGSLLDAAAAKLLGGREPQIRRKQEQLVNRVGDLKLVARTAPLISLTQVADVARLLQPGDLLLTRKEGYLSNAAMPGFWKHATVYVGTPSERRRMFSTPEVRAWVRAGGIPSGNLETLLKQLNAGAWRATRAASLRTVRPVVESNSDGVCMSTLESVALADSLAIVRPRLDPLALAQAIARAFSFVGRPYDYLFDFSCDRAMICSEVVYRAFCAGPNRAGLALQVREISGRLAMPTNDLVMFYARRRGDAAQDLDFVAFLDGDEEQGRADWAAELDFARSWKRHVWRPFTGAGRANPPLLTGEHGCAFTGAHRCAAERDRGPKAESELCERTGDYDCAPAEQ
ncbi:MAG: hypothetical protein H6698_02000 [Myxococcales bacterium]|nr:hypothetical protein [Myxococcales bacterium]